MRMNEERFSVANPFKFQSADQYAERDGFPMFSILEITTSFKCTRACSFCPRSEGWRDESHGVLALSNAQALVTELRDLNFKGNVILSGTGEPMSHPNWMELAIIVTGGPWKSQLITNGDYLKNCEQVGMFDIVCVSLYDGPHQDEKFSTMLDGLNYELRRRYRHQFLQLSNRAGWMKWEPRGMFIDAPCNYPMYQLTMNHDGRVALCCQDWSGTDLGNVFKSGLWNVWTGEKLRSVRETLFKNRNLSPCNKCDVSGVLSGSKHAAQWQRVYGRQ